MNNPLARAEKLVQDVLDLQNQLIQELLAEGKHPDDWVLVDNMNELLSGKTDKYVCKAKFLLKQDRDLG